MQEKRDGRRSAAAVSVIFLLAGCSSQSQSQKPAPPPPAPAPSTAAAPAAAAPAAAPPAAEPPAAGPLGPGEHAPRVTQFSKRLKAPVGLSDDQVKQIKAIEQHAHDEKPTGDQAARRDQWVRQNDKMFAEARAILDADQQAKFDKWVRTELYHQKNVGSVRNRARAAGGRRGDRTVRGTDERGA